MNAKRPAKKRPRAPAPVVIPVDPILERHAAAIRELGRRSFDDVVEIGERLIACRKILKDRRIWLAWLRAEFRFSRRHADRLIAVAKNKQKCAALRALGVPIAALYDLAQAPPETIQRVTQHIEGGERPTVRALLHLTRPPPPPRQVTITVTHPPPQPPRLATDIAADIAADFVADFVAGLEGISGELEAMITQDIGTSKLTADDCRAIDEFCRAIGEHATTIRKSIERPQLTLVSKDET